jgi:hypothetical protein
MNPPGRETTIKGRPIIPMVQVAHDNMGGDWTGLWITYPTKKGPHPLKSIRMGFERARDRAGLTEQITPYTRAPHDLHGAAKAGRAIGGNRRLPGAHRGRV